MYFSTYTKCSHINDEIILSSFIRNLFVCNYIYWFSHKHINYCINIHIYTTQCMVDHV